MAAGSSNHRLPLARATGALAASATLGRLGLPAGPYLERAGLSMDWLESDPEGFIPVRCLYRLLEAAGRDVDGFGALVADVPIESFGRFGRLIRHALTVRDALEDFVALGPSMANLHTMWLQPDRQSGGLWLLRSGKLPFEGGVAHSELLVLRFMTQLVRSAAGSGWKPKALRFASRGEAIRAVAVVPAFQGVPVETGAAWGGVLVAREALGLRMPPRARPSDDDPLRWRDQPAPDDELAPALRELLVSLVRAQQPATIGCAAELTGLHPRSIQRILAREGTSYRHVSDQARYLVSRELIETEMDRPLTEIAFDVGYSDLAAFTRAFRRWAGTPPSAIRDATR